MPRFSANLGFLWPDRPLIDRVEAAARAGFKAIEMHWPYELPPETINDLCGRFGLKLLGINTVRGDINRGEFGLAAAIGREADFEMHFNQALRWGRLAGACSVHVMSGVIAPENKHLARRTLIANLERAAEAAPDMSLLLEGLNPRDNPGYFYSTIKEKAEIIDEVGAPNLKIMFDAYHVAVSEGDIFKRFAKYQPLIGHVQIAAVPSRAEPDEGEIAYGNFFRELDRVGYDGWIGCEYRPRADTDEGLRWVKALDATL